MGCVPSHHTANCLLLNGRAAPPICCTLPVLHLAHFIKPCTHRHLATSIFRRAWQVKIASHGDVIGMLRKAHMQTGVHLSASCASHDSVGRDYYAAFGFHEAHAQLGWLMCRYYSPTRNLALQPAGCKISKVQALHGQDLRERSTCVLVLPSWYQRAACSSKTSRSILLTLSMRMTPSGRPTATKARI